MTTEDFKTLFKEEYDKLNKQQKKAVDTVEGPVMVIAGPGTGKTQILSRRVANILTNYHTSPEEIVCLTYTEAGASEMLDRLEKLIGEEGRKVRVSTIHAFCSELILRNSEIFGGQPKIISTAAKYEILKEIMDEYVIEGNPLYKNSGKRYSAKDQLLELFYKMKRENLNKEDFEKEIDEYFKMIDLSVPGDELYGKFKYSQARNGKNLGDFKSNYDNEQQKMQKLLAGVDIVEKYSNDISEHNYFDFDDMILWTIEKLEENDDFQRNVSDTIKYLFVDEFQDTSVVQNKLVDLLVKGKDNPNIFVVGDDDQSIYRFQGVSANNIRDFDKKYKPTKIVLDENYRSSQAIIDASRQLISHNPREEKLLIAAGANKDYDYQLPILKSYANAKAEMFGVLTEIKELIDSGVSPDEIGVIYGRNSYGEEFDKILRDNGIFVQMKENKDLFSEPFFKKIVAILKYLCKPSRNVRELRKIVYFDFFEIELSEIAMIRNLKKDEKISIPTIAEIDKKLEIVRKKVNKSSKYLSPMYVLSDVLKSLSIDEYIMKSKEKYHLVSVLNELYKLMLMECHIHPKLTVKEFLNQLSALEEMGISLPIVDISGSPSNCVQLMTAHGSKGLEFEHVFIMKCNDGKKKSEAWPGGENNSGRFAYPPSLNGKDENESQLKEEENRRLFYVAMTRAKKVLHLSYSDDSTKTHFINEFEEFIDEVDVTESFEDFQSVDKVVIPKFSNNVIKEIFDELSLSVSTLNAFLKCPLSFYFNKGLKLPSETNEAMVFGSIIHEVLEKIYISVDSSQSSELTAKTVLSPEEALKLFETVFEEKSYQLSADRVKRDAYVRGKKIIENLYNKTGYLKDGVIAVEVPIQGVKLGSILNTTVDLSEVSDIELNGKIDKIECEEGVIRLIDYKTGKAKNAKDKLVPPSEKEPLGGDYWRQAVFYYILFKNAGIDISDKEILVKYVFVEDSTNEDGFSETQDIQITQKEVDIVLNQIKESIMKIKQGDFNCGCGVLKKDRDNYPCDYCLQVLANT
jgi:DNA-dependent ATPase I and helicase II